MLEAFLEDHFYKALDWVLKQNEFVVETSLVGVVMNGLSHMHGVKVKSEFACSLIRGLGGNLSSSAKTAFAKEVTYCGFFKCQRDCGNDSCLLSLTTSLGSSECDLNYLQGEVFKLCIIAINEQIDDSSLKSSWIPENCTSIMHFLRYVCIGSFVISVLLMVSPFWKPKPVIDMFCT